MSIGRPGADDRDAARQGRALDPLFVHIGGIAGIIGIDHDRVGDLTGGIAPRVADRDVSGTQLACPERFQRHAALAAILPFGGIGQVVLAAKPEVRDLIGLFEPVMLHLR
ncbi:hypothetical protein ACVWZ3_003889 [Bradyrhizobium sp. i1.3.6]